MTTVSFRIDDRTKRRLDTLQARHGVKLSHVFRAGVADKLAELERFYAARRAAHPEEAVVEVLSDNPAVEKVVLFGSRARGDATERADIDVAVSAPDLDAGGWLDLLASLEEAETLLVIDAVHLEEAQPPFREEILRTGKVIYER